MRENVELRAELQGRFRLDRLVGKSPPMQRMFELVPHASRRPRPRCSSPARAAPARSWSRARSTTVAARATTPFVAVNCGAIPEALLEAELFGHVKGAFTGAHADKPGLFARADGGTLFLDEIGELPPRCRSSCCASCRSGKVKPVGGVAEEEVDVRVVAATNRDLEAEVERGALPARSLLPPQRHPAAPAAAARAARGHPAARRALPPQARRRARPHASPASSRDALAALVRYDLPGNVRELENMIERAVALEPGERITRASLPELTNKAPPRPPASPAASPTTASTSSASSPTSSAKLIRKALERTSGVRKSAAKLLGISFRSLRYRLAKLGLAGGDDSDDEDADLVLHAYSRGDVFRHRDGNFRLRRRANWTARS